MHLLRSRVAYSASIFLLLFALIVLAGPRHLFERDGKPRAFGLGPERTMWSLGSLSQGLAVATTFAFAIVEMADARVGSAAPLQVPVSAFGL
jgi:hypothetical protein